MNDIYAAPQASLVTESQQQSVDYQLFKVSGVGVATFFGTMLAGGILLSINFKRLGNQKAAKNALIYSAIATVVVFAIAMLIPEGVNIPNVVFTVPQILAMVQIAKQQQELDIAYHIDNGGQMASNWKAFGLSLLVLIGFVVLVVPVVWLFLI